MLCPLETEMAGELVAEGTVLGSQAGDLGLGVFQPLAERVGACVVLSDGGWRSVVA